MNENFTLYLKLRKRMNNILSSINFIDVYEEWPYFYKIIPNTYNYYKTII